MKNKTITVGLLLASFLVPQISYAKLSMNSVEISGRRSECLDRAQNAMLRLGFLNVERLDYSVFGTDAPYNIGVYCKAEKGIAFFVAEGPQVQEATKIVNMLMREF
jgi:hypothetical protein